MSSTPTPTPAPKPVIDVKALGATIVRWAVPAIVSVAVAVAAKAGFKLDPTQAYAEVAPAVGVVVTGAFTVLEAKVPWLSRLFIAKKPASVIKTA